MQSALIPTLIRKRSASSATNATDKYLVEGVAFLTGVLLMAALAQIQVRLPWGPVPITGQTLGVALIALTYGAKRSAAVLAAYLFFGFVGAPIFAFATTGFVLGPTTGYLIGMFVAAAVVGFLADKGAARSFWRALGAAYLGSVIIFGLGLFVLSYFVPADQLLVAGLIPFMAGDFLKNTMAAAISSGLSKAVAKK